MIIIIIVIIIVILIVVIIVIPPTVTNKGIVNWSTPLSNFFSFRIVNNEFKIALLALNISSKNAILAVGKNPSTFLQ